MKPWKKIRSDQDFDFFYELILKKTSTISITVKPELSRKRSKINNPLLQYFGDCREASNSANLYHQSSCQHFRMIYFEAIHSIVSAIKIDSSSLVLIYSQTSLQLLLESINGKNYQQELDNFLKIFGDDIDLSALRSGLLIINTICKDWNLAHFDDVLSIRKVLSTNERLVMKNFIVIVKIMLVYGAITAVPEKSFSMTRRIKTWLLSTMTQRRYNALAILNSNKCPVDKLPLVKVASDFANSLLNRRNNFGAFTEEDLN